MLRTTNPAMRAFERAGSAPSLSAGTSTMTVQGTVNKTFILIAFVIGTAALGWEHAMQALRQGQMFPNGLLMGGVIGGLIMAMVTIFKPQWSAITAPLYALIEGYVLGLLSAMFEAAYAGIVAQAILGTLGVFLAMLVLYKTQVIKVTDKFRMGVVAATAGIFIAYLLSMILGFFGVSMGFMHGSSPLSIMISVAIVVVAALNLVLDFDLIEKGERSSAPTYMEWYGGFALLVTLVWLYLEILRLLSKLNSRN